MEEPPFPDYPCDGCGKSFVDMEQEEAQQKALEKEQTRIESGAVYRRLEQEHAHKKIISMQRQVTLHVIPMMLFILKIWLMPCVWDQETWQQQILPLLRDELAQQGLEESVLTTTWGQRVLTFF
jgi:hypothetical protein